MEEKEFSVGVVVGTHGLRGDLKVRPLTAESGGLFDARRVTLVTQRGETRIVEPVRVAAHKQFILLALKGYDHISKVEHLVGADVRMALEDLPQLEEDASYWYQLEGMTVIDRQRGELGVLKSLIETAAHDIYIVEGPYGEIMIPAVKAMVERIDEQQRCMYVSLPDELIGLNG
ncbi:MAG: 16S rRNA processing protein RimM [Desulfuromonadaceae bacterium]|nr:16S rRNA processing protein RimM [Desulfuromonadaceae bacterium]